MVSTVYEQIAGHAAFVASSPGVDHRRLARGVVSVALASKARPIAAGAHRFLGLDDVALYALIDIPPVGWRGRTRWWFTSYRIATRFGVPGIWPELCQGGTDLALPRGTVPRLDARHAEVALRLSWASTTAAAIYQRRWRPLQASFRAALSLPGDDPGLLILGSSRFHPAVTKNPVAWAPRVYLGFAVATHRDLFHWCTGRGSWGGSDGTIPLGMLRDFGRFVIEGGRFTAPMAGTVRFTNHSAHIDGERMDYALPLPPGARPLIDSGTRVALGDRVAELGWSIESDLARRGNWWTDLGHRLGKQRLRGTVEDWFAWQTLVVDEGLNRVHVPARYAAVVAQEADVHDVLLDVGPCSSFYEEETGCYYLPPLTAHPYDRFHFALDEMELDLTPREMCFCR